MKETYIIDEKIQFIYDDELLIIDDQKIHLRPQCCELLLLFIRSYEYKKNEVVTFKEIGSVLWTSYSFVWEGDLKEKIKHTVSGLRKALGNKHYIANDFNKGYKFCCESLVKVPSDIELSFEEKETHSSILLSNSAELKNKAAFTFNKFKEADKTLKAMRENINLIANLIFRELTMRQIHSFAYQLKQKELSSLMRRLVRSNNDLDSIESTLNILAKEYNIKNFKDPHTINSSIDTVSYVLSELAVLKPEIEFLEKTIFRQQHEFYYVLSTFKSNEKKVFKLINLCFNHHKANQYGYIDYENEKCFAYYFKAFHNEPKDNN